MAIRKPQRKSNRQLWIMLALIVVIVAVIALLPSGEESATDRQQEDRELAETTLVKAGDTAPDFTVEMSTAPPSHSPNCAERSSCSTSGPHGARPAVRS